jgi:hypothetical protein
VEAAVVAAAAAAVAAAADPIVRVWTRRDDAWSLRAPSSLLDGNVPLRAAQACVPFIEGNGAGLSLQPRRAIVLQKTRSTWTCADPSVSLMTRRGTLVATIDTGLTIEPVGGVLELDRSYNRSDRRVEIQRARVDVRTNLRLELSLSAPSDVEEIALDGPLASMIMTPDEVRWAGADAACAKAMIDRHAGFFDREYFVEKRQGATKRYRERGREPLASLVDPARCDAVALSLTSAVAREQRSLVVRAELAFNAENYGAHTRCRCDVNSIDARAVALRAALHPLREMTADDPSLLYFAHYAMAHTHGDPRVLVKPSLLVATREDWVLVVDGPRAECLRGVSEAQWFHAVPVVMDVFTRLSVRAGSPIARVRAIPRSMLHPAIERVR